MEMISSEHPLGLGNTDLVDRISNLPDFILSYILSFLPTKEAVAAVLLSKRWNFLWRSVHNLDFYHSPPSNSDLEDEYRKFIEFVNRVLHLHDGRMLNKFSLSLNTKGCGVNSHPYSWISTAITKNVRSLYVNGNNLSGTSAPESVFRCDSLRSLELIDVDVRLSDTLVVSLPRLETLRLDQLLFKSEQDWEKFISGCPLLKNMHLRIEDYDSFDFKCRISSPSLRCLNLYFDQLSSLKLNTPSLENLDLGGRIREIIIESSLSSLVEAYLDFDFSFEEVDDDDDFEGEEVKKFVVSYNSIVEAIRAFHCVKVLSLTPDAYKALECATISLSTEFKRLVKLHSCPCSSLQDFIRISDNLEVLEIDQEYCEFSMWITLDEVPRCFSNNLKKVKFYYCTYGEDEFETIRFVLEHGSALEVVKIFRYNNAGERARVRDQEMLKVAQKILSFPRKSPACRVHLSEWY